MSSRSISHPGAATAKAIEGPEVDGLHVRVGRDVDGQITVDGLEGGDRGQELRSVSRFRARGKETTEGAGASRGLGLRVLGGISHINGEGVFNARGSDT